MVNKKTLLICLGVILICLVIAGIGLIVNRSVSRDATLEELERYQQYDRGLGKTELLAVCTYQEDAAIGSGSYRMYTSAELPGLLYHCAELERIAEDASGMLFIQYRDPDNRTVTLAYSDSALTELAVYDPEADILFHSTPEKTEVWEKFNSGVQWGK